MQKLLRIDDYPTAPVAGFGDAKPWFAFPARLFPHLCVTANAWAVRSATRRALAELEPHQLADIGKTSAEARRESGKPFWQA